MGQYSELKKFQLWNEVHISISYFSVFYESAGSNTAATEYTIKTLKLISYRFINRYSTVERGSCSVSYLPNRSASARNSSVVVDYLKKKRASSQNILKENPELYQGNS